MPRNLYRLPVLIILFVIYFYLIRNQPHINRQFTEKLSPCQKPYQYAIVLDAGSTGSRIHVYKFNKCKSTVLEDEVFRTTTPGLSSMAPVEAAHSLDKLMNAALESVPPSMFYCTPLTLKATAGLRMLPDGQGSKILKEVEKRLREYPFPLVKDGVEIMAGEQEGIYAWITLNYLLKNIGTGQRLPTAGIMDLGGGSTQIVFEQENIPAGKHKVNLEFGGFSYVLYQHSFDGYGLMQGRKKIHEIALRTGTSSPCLTAKTEIVFSSKTIKGIASSADQCLNLISTHLFDKTSDICSLSPCSFDGVYMPKISESHQMFAFSYFFDKFANPFDSHSYFNVGQIKAAAHKICSSSPPALGIEGKKELERNLEWCTDLGYIYSLLSVGYDLPDDRVIKSTKKVDGIEIGWSLGCAIQMLDTFEPLCS